MLNIGYDEFTPSKIDTKKGAYARIANSDSTGNWCGHDKENPRYYYGKLAHKKRPMILEKAKASAERFYESPNKIMCGLKVIRHSNRQVRSESREAIASVIQVLMHYIDLASLRFVMPTSDGSLFCPTMKFIAKSAGIGMKRLSRVIAELKKVGYLKVCERYKKKDGDYIGLSAVKCVRPQLFYALGISHLDLEMQRKRASKALIAKERMRRQSEHSLLLSKLSFSSSLSKNDKQQVGVLKLFAQTSGNDADLSVVSEIKELWSKVYNPQYH